MAYGLVNEGRNFNNEWAVHEIARASGSESPVVMAVEPHQLYEGTRLTTVKLPTGDVETILDVARRYGVEFLYLDGNSVPESLRAIYSGQLSDERFKLGAVQGSRKLFAITATGRER